MSPPRRAELAGRPDLGEVIERIRETKRLADTRGAVAEILAHRDADRS